MKSYCFLDISKIILYFLLFSLSSKYQNNNISLVDKISVIIPTYNRGKYIINSLNSVLSQTYQNLEIILIDDCSNDDTEFLISKINDKRIKYIKLKENKGANYARNIGIKLATGKYISFQDSDDIYHENKIEKQYKNLIKKKSDLDFCRICVNYNSSYRVIFPRVYQEKSIRRRRLNEELCNGNFISTQSILIRNSLIKNYLFDTNFTRLQDYDLILRIIPNSKVSYSKEVLVELFRNDDNISNNLTKLEKSYQLLSLKNYNIKCKEHSFLYNIYMTKFNNSFE